MNLINWDNVFEKSDEFKNQQPFKFGYIKNIFNLSKKITKNNLNFNRIFKQEWNNKRNSKKI